jgi:hypothetical protein
LLLFLTAAKTCTVNVDWTVDMKVDMEMGRGTSTGMVAWKERKEQGCPSTPGRVLQKKGRAGSPAA